MSDEPRTPRLSPPDPRPASVRRAALAELEAHLAEPSSPVRQLVGAFAKVAYRDRVAAWQQHSPSLLARVRDDPEGLASLWSAVDHATWQQTREATEQAATDPAVATASSALVRPFVPPARARLGAAIEARLRGDGPDCQVVWGGEPLEARRRVPVGASLARAMCCPPGVSEVELVAYDWSGFAFFATGAAGGLRVRAVAEVQLHIHTPHHRGVVVRRLVRIGLPTTELANASTLADLPPLQVATM